MTDLVLRGSLLGERQYSRNANRQMVTTDIVNLSLLDQRPDLGLLQVLNLVLIRGSQMRAHAAVVTGDDDTALARGLGLIYTVLGMHTGLLACLLENVGVLVATNAADVEHRVFGEDVLSNVLGINIWLAHRIARVASNSARYLPAHHEPCSVQHHQRSIWHRGC